MHSLPPIASASDRFQRGLLALREQADARIFWVVLAQWTVTLFASIAVASREDHPRLDLLSIAVIAIGGLSILQLGMILRWPGRPQTRWVIVGSEAVISSLLWYASGGGPESHFHLFAWLVVLAMYRDVPVLLATVLTSLSAHLIMVSSGAVPALPATDATQLVTYLIWMAWMVGETSFLTAFVVLDRQGLASQTDREYALEALQQDLESKFALTSQQLVEEKNALQQEVSRLTERRKAIEASQQETTRELLALRRDVAAHGTAILKFASRPADSSLSKTWQSHWHGLRQQAQHLMQLIDLPSLQHQGRVHPNRQDKSREPRREMVAPPSEKRAMLLMRNPLQQAKAVTALEREGFRVDVVPNGPRTYYSVMLNEYSLIVVDIDLPDDEGFDTLEALQLLPTDQLGRSKTLIAVTSEITSERAQRCTELGIDNLILKPLRTDAVRELLSHNSVIQPAWPESSLRRSGASSAVFGST